MSKNRGVVAAGHPLTANAGAQVLRDGGNAVDAAVCAMLTSFVAESPLTGLASGGFMLVHTPSGEDHLLDFFVASPSKIAPSSTQVPIEVDFDGALQTFYCGPASCGVYGSVAGVCEAAQRFGSIALSDLAAPAIELARNGVETTQMHEFLYQVLDPILTRWPECCELYAANGHTPRVGEKLRLSEVGLAIERLAQEGPEPFYSGEIAAAVSDWVLDRGGTITRKDLADYAVVDRPVGSIDYRGLKVVTNPPPSSGGILVAGSLKRLAAFEQHGLREMVDAIGAANAARTEQFTQGLTEDGFFDRFIQSDAIGSTTHISVLDANGMAVSVTCSNGCGSGIAVPGTGMVLNNMLGEADLHPHGVDAATPGARITSMMAPTVVLEDGQPMLVLGSAGSNRIRSAILQVIANVVDHGMSIEQAVVAPRIHFEAGVVQAEPGLDQNELGLLEAAGFPVVQWQQRNLFFGGCQAAGLDHRTGEIAGAGDPRRGGAAVLV